MAARFEQTADSYSTRFAPVNLARAGDVLQVIAMAMHEAIARYGEPAVIADEVLDRDFEAAVRDTADLAVRVAFGVLRQREDAEDAAQEAFARAYREFAQLRDRQHFRAWIIRVVWRLAIDRWRSDRRRHNREQSVEAAVAASAEELAAAAQRAARLRAAIDDLPDKLRLVIVLSAIEGHDVQEVARLLDIPVGTVKSRLFLARKGLAQRLRCLVNDTPTR